MTWLADPVATVKHLKDPEALDAARRMKPKTYIAYVHQVCHNSSSALDAARRMKPKTHLAYVHQAWSWDFALSYQVYDIILLSHAPPERNEESGIEPDMCTPVAPTTFHPSGREPLQPSRPLPFESCYLHSNTPINKVKAKTIWRRFDTAIVLTESEHFRDGELAGKDRNRMRRLRHDFLQRQRQSTQGDSGTDSADHWQIPKPATGEYKVMTVLRRGVLQKQLVWFPPKDEEEQNADKAADPVVRIPSIAPLLFARGTPDESMVAITNISYNLGRVKDFEEPTEFFKEEAYLKQLIQESKERAAAQAQKLDDEIYGGGTAQDVISNATREGERSRKKPSIGNRAAGMIKTCKDVVNIPEQWKLGKRISKLVRAQPFEYVILK